MTNKEVVILDSSQEPVAEIVNKYGDPETFAEREIKIDDAVLQKLPIGTQLYMLTLDAAMRKENEQLREALSDALSVINSISDTKFRKRKFGEDVAYLQLETWVRWALDEVLPKVRAALKGGAA